MKPNVSGFPIRSERGASQPSSCGLLREGSVICSLGWAAGAYARLLPGVGVRNCHAIDPKNADERPDPPACHPLVIVGAACGCSYRCRCRLLEPYRDCDLVSPPHRAVTWRVSGQIRTRRRSVSLRRRPASTGSRRMRWSLPVRRLIAHTHGGARLAPCALLQLHVARAHAVRCMLPDALLCGRCRMPNVAYCTLLAERCCMVYALGVCCAPYGMGGTRHATLRVAPAKRAPTR